MAGQARGCDADLCDADKFCRRRCNIERTLVVRAKKSIPRGTELTWDYRETDIIPQGIPCWCEEPKCVL